MARRAHRATFKDARLNEHTCATGAEMKTFNIHEAKTHLSRLVQMAANGEPFIIAKAGKPLVMVTAIEAPLRPVKRIGFMAGHIRVPADFDTMGQAEIEREFLGEK